MPASAVVTLAVLNHGVRPTAEPWVGIGAMFWIGILHFAVTGYFADVGGLRMPTSELPEVLRDIPLALPSSGLTELGWKVAEATRVIPARRRGVRR